MAGWQARRIVGSCAARTRGRDRCRRRGWRFCLLPGCCRWLAVHLVDIQIHKTDKVYFMNFEHLGIERKDGDDMFEQIWFVFENGYKLELTTDHCDYMIFREVK